MREEVTFNNVVLSDFLEVAGVIRPFVGRNNSTREVSGARGVRLTGSTMMPATITVRLVMGNMDATARREAVRDLAFALHTDEPQKLFISSDNGLYYMAILDGESPFTEHVRSGIVEVNFVSEDPALYGKEHSVVVPSGGNVSFFVDGTCPTRPTIRSTTAKGASSSYLWGVRLDDGDYLRMVTGSTLDKTVEIDCEARVGKLSGSPKLPVLGSDWFELQPGFHVVANDVGSGASTLTWQDRWI